MNLVRRVDGRVTFLVQQSEQLALEYIELVSHLRTHVALVNDALYTTAGRPPPKSSTNHNDDNS